GAPVQEEGGDAAEERLVPDHGHALLATLDDEIDDLGDAPRGEQAAAHVHVGVGAEGGDADLTGLDGANVRRNEPTLGNGIVAERPGARAFAHTAPPGHGQRAILLLNAFTGRNGLAVA